MRSLIISFNILLIAVLYSCSGSKDTVLSVDNENQLQIPANRLTGGASGMDQLNDRLFVGIYDLKSYAEGPRVVVIKTLPDEPLSISPVIIGDWNDPEGKPTDLESICRIGDTGTEFLMAEAGTWQGNYGRLFHLYIDTITNEGKILGVVKLPFVQTNDFDLVGDQYEGIACFRTSEKRITVILAERGGSEIFPEGILRWGVLDLEDYSLEFSDKGMNGLKVDAPGNWINPESKRDITALHVDNEGIIWAAASQDIGDSGPFYSVIYQLGRLRTDGINPVDVFNDLKIWREISGYKIEALSGPSAMVPNSRISFATEDEAFGGNWRAIE